LASTPKALDIRPPSSRSLTAAWNAWAAVTIRVPAALDERGTVASPAALAEPRGHRSESLLAAKENRMNPRIDRARRAAAYLGLSAALALVTLTLSQCMMVGDNITGVSLDRSARATCIQNCKDTRDECRESVFHDCNGDESCIEAGIARCQD